MRQQGDSHVTVKEFGRFSPSLCLQDPPATSLTPSIPPHTRCYNCLCCAVLCAQSLSRVQLLQPHGLQPARLLCPWGFSRREYSVGCHVLLQGIFPTQGSNPVLPHYRWILYHLSHQGNLMSDSYAFCLLPTSSVTLNLHLNYIFPAH